MLFRALLGSGVTEAPLLQQTHWLLCQQMHKTLCLHTRAHLFHLSQLDPRAPLLLFPSLYSWECLYPVPWTSTSQKGHCHHHCSTIFELSALELSSASSQILRTETLRISHGPSACFVHAVHTEQPTAEVLDVSKHEV